MDRNRMRTTLAHRLTLVALFTAATAVTSPPARLATIHYQANGKLVFLPVTIEHHTLWFSFDSGAMHTVIDSATARRLGIRSVAQGYTGGAGRGTVTLLHAVPLD